MDHCHISLHVTIKQSLLYFYESVQYTVFWVFLISQCLHLGLDILYLCTLGMFDFWKLIITIAMRIDLEVLGRCQKKARYKAELLLVVIFQKMKWLLGISIFPSNKTLFLLSQWDLLFPQHNTFYQMGKACPHEYYWLFFEVIPCWLLF